MDNRSERLLEIGRIVGTHGLKGDLKVRPSFGDPELLLAIEQIMLRLPSGDELTVEPSRQSLHKGQVLLRLQGYESINQAEPLVGGSILLPQELLPELDSDEYYWHQLEGIEVIDAQSGSIGCIQDMFTTAAHDTYVVKGRFGEVLIPAVEQFIQEVNLEEKIMHVDLPEGLIPQQQ